MSNKQKIFVTGGCGFIGSNFIRYLLEQGKYSVVNYDALTYAGNPANLKDIEDSSDYTFIKGNICNKDLVLESVKDCDIIINFAAESHVDRSIKNSKDFIETNIIGTANLLEAARKVGIKKFVQIGTDEVYGSLSMQDESSKEDSLVEPSSPYSSSKAAADMIALSYFKTYGLPVVVTRSSNNYGPYQFPEKLIPLFVTNVIEGEKVPLMGDGENIRDWIYVEDNCSAILTVMEKGKIGEVYNIAGETEVTNRKVTDIILDFFGKDESWIKKIPHRLGHDFRYSMNCDKIKELGWNQKYNFQDGIIKTIEWYKNNEEWWKILKGEKK